MASEAQIARAVVRYLTDHEWEVFPEVLCPRGRRVADIFARRRVAGRWEYWEIETKRTFGLRVLEQAVYWQSHAHRVSVAVILPRGRRHRAFALRIARLLGIGVIDVRGGRVTEHQSAQRRPNPKVPLLVEEMKRYTPGNAQGAHWTPLEGTFDKLADYVRANPGCSLTTAISGISHHYKHARSAYASLRKHLVSGRVPSVQVRPLKGELYLRPKP